MPGQYKVAIVTGAGSGIGRAVSLALLEDGEHGAARRAFDLALVHEHKGATARPKGGAHVVAQLHVPESLGV